MSKRKLIIWVLPAAVLAVALAACKKSGSSGGGTAAAPAGPAVPLGTPQMSPAGGKLTSGGRPGANGPRVVRAARNARNDELWNLGQQAVADMNLVCARGSQGGEKVAASVTHYYIAPNIKAGDDRCKSGFGYFGQPAMAGTCLHPCRTLAADPRYYRPGEILFFKNLVGLNCGTGRNKMIHDGFMVVADNGNPEAINIEGRFGVFWGKCNAEQNGFCLDDGAVTLDFALTFSPYCRAWRPQDPIFHDEIKLAVYNRVRKEAAARGDNQAASKFDLDEWIGIGIDGNGILFRRSPPPVPWRPFVDGGN